MRWYYSVSILRAHQYLSAFRAHLFGMLEPSWYREYLTWRYVVGLLFWITMKAPSTRPPTA